MPMRPCSTQCRGCPFRPGSAPGWLGSYRNIDVFQSLWHGMPFFCHTRIRYNHESWLERALKNGRLCLGGLTAAERWHCPPWTDPVLQAARDQARQLVAAAPDIVQVFESPRQFLDHHQQQRYLER